MCVCARVRSLSYKLYRNVCVHIYYKYYYKLWELGFVGHSLIIPQTTSKRIRSILRSSALNTSHAIQFNEACIVISSGPVKLRLLNVHSSLSVDTALLRNAKLRNQSDVSVCIVLTNRRKLTLCIPISFVDCAFCNYFLLH